jgi:hypothetical protein
MDDNEPLYKGKKFKALVQESLCSMTDAKEYISQPRNTDSIFVSASGSCTGHHNSTLEKKV